MIGFGTLFDIKPGDNCVPGVPLDDINDFVGLPFKFQLKRVFRSLGLALFGVVGIFIKVFVIVVVPVIAHGCYRRLALCSGSLGGFLGSAMKVLNFNS